uniref:Uncharacterized protein n=1 Tax=Oryza punctata TaxID=4537 RepID=A0A0E0LZ87_ORYPU
MRQSVAGCGGRGHRSWVSPVCSIPIIGVASASAREEYCTVEERVLMVCKTSHFSPGHGFAAYDHRADTYGHDHAGEGASVGKALITVRRRYPSLHHR